MKFYEYSAKELFRSEGIPVPEGSVARTPQEASEVAENIDSEVAIKAQVLTGGRGKAGV